MSDLQLVQAAREKVKIRLSIASPTGFGKTYSALKIAYGITGDWKKIAVIDTENDSASLYSDLGPFWKIRLAPPFSSHRYIEAIQLCEANGIKVIIIDSVTHVWKGQGGLLEYNDSLGGKFSDWAKTTPLYQKWLDSILQSKCHVICTARKKQAYTVKNEGGRQKVEKVGLEDQIRDGFDYEMTIAFELINDQHLATPAKDRTRLFVGKPEFVISEETGRQIKAWCESGVEPAAKTTPPVEPTEFMHQGHPGWAAVTDALLNKGYSVASVKTKYLLQPEVEVVLNSIVLARTPSGQPAAPKTPAPVTQQQIAQGNATYVPPAQSAHLNGVCGPGPAPGAKPVGKPF